MNKSIIINKNVEKKHYSLTRVKIIQTFWDRSKFGKFQNGLP